MTVKEFLQSLPDREARRRFRRRVRRIGAPSVDLFSQTEPTDIHENPTHIDSVLATVEVPNGDGTVHYHTLVSRAQYAFWTHRTQRPDWVREANRAARKYFRRLRKSNGEDQDTPRNVFGASVFDPEENQLIFPGRRPNRRIDDNDETPVRRRRNKRVDGNVRGEN